MQPVVTAAEMRALDRATIDEVGLPALTLMETAGRAVAEVAVRMLEGELGHVAVVCGPGNNGGDGFVIARVLRQRGVDAVAYLAVDRDLVKGDARAHLEILERAGGVVRSIATPATLDEVREGIERAVLAVDALFGIGPTRPIDGHLAQVIEVTNRVARRLAVDIPSGLDADTGRTLGHAVDAHRTVTMGALKIALVSAPGFARCGEVEVVDIGIPGALIAETRGAGLVDHADVRRWLPRAAQLDHKGTRGHVVVIGGTAGMRGAGRLAAIAALRAGAGLVTLATDGGDPVAGARGPTGAAPAVSGSELAAVRDGRAIDVSDSVMTRTVAGSVAAVIAGKHAIVIGCGLGTSADAITWVGDVLAAGIPCVLDADALNALSRDPSALARAAGPVVITPHPGEAARLLGITTAQVEADRLSAARTLAALTRAVVVLKGARTIVCDGTLGDEFCSINPTGGPALATAGSGDVLAGVIGALLAQGLSPVDAARAGVYVHGRAGEQLSGIHGARGVVSSDLPAAIALAIHLCT